MAKYRAQILLEPDQHKKLAEIAGQTGRSVSDVVREAVAEYVVEQARETERERRLKAFEKIREHRAAILRDRGGEPIELDTVELVHQMREERDNELLAAVESLKKHRR